MMAVFEFLLVGYWFWISLGVLSFLCCSMLDDGWFISTLATLGMGWLIYLKLGLKFDGNYLSLAGYFALYFVIGILWSIGKWYFTVRKAASLLRESIDEVMQEYELEDESFINVDVNAIKFKAEDNYTEDNYINKEARLALGERLNTKFSAEFPMEARARIYLPSDYTRARLIEEVKPLAARNKGLLTRWIAFWPWSLTWTMINEPIKKIAEQLFYHLKQVYSKISDSAFKDFK
jgi:hypothetical protein